MSTERLGGDKRLSILFVVPSDYASLVRKGVAHMILERDEGGFFHRVFTFHPSASQTQTLDLNETHHLIEFGPDYPFPLPGNRLLGKAVRSVNRLLRPVLAIGTLVRLVRREGIDLIRATDPYRCGFYAWATSKLTGVPFGVSIHADYEKVYRLLGERVPFSFEALERFVLPRAHLVMPISEYLGRLATSHGASADRIRVMYHGIDSGRFLQPRAVDLGEFGVSGDEKILSMVGRLSRQKYVYDALEVARRLARSRSDFVLIFVGDGEEREGLQSLVAEHDLSASVRFAGFQPSDKVAAILARSDVAFCLLAGFALIETGMAGVPAVCYDIEWHRELIEDGKTGFLIEEGDLDALTEAVAYLLDHPRKAREMGTRAREVAIARHELSRTSEIKRDCYRELLGLGVPGTT